MAGGAARQAVRAGAREGNGTGGGVAAAAAGASSQLVMPNLRAPPEDVRELLQGQTIVKKPMKFNIVRNIHNINGPLLALLEGLDAGLSTNLAAINWNLKSGGGFKAATSWGAEDLGSTIFDLHRALRRVMPRAQNHSALLPDQIGPITALSVTYQQALHTANTTHMQKFSSQVITLVGGAKDRSFLHLGARPNIEEQHTCIFCNHEWIDEPNSNSTNLQHNLRVQAQYDSQAEMDRVTWANGGDVTNDKGETMTRGRRRPKPKLKPIIQVCHCGQFGCTTATGVVPTSECPIQCIDIATNARYGIDQVTGECLCPLCICTCAAA